MNQNMSNSDLLQFASSIESAANSIYLVFQKQFSDNHPAASKIWAQLADDESNHAAELQRILDTMPQDKLDAPVDEEAVRIISRIVLDVDQVKNRVLNQTKTLKDAYELAHELEYSEVNALFEYCTLGIIPCEDRKDFIVGMINEHLARLDRLSELL